MEQNVPMNGTEQKLLFLHRNISFVSAKVSAFGQKKKQALNNRHNNQMKAQNQAKKSNLNI